MGCISSSAPKEINTLDVDAQCSQISTGAFSWTLNKSHIEQASQSKRKLSTIRSPSFQFDNLTWHIVLYPKYLYTEDTTKPFAYLALEQPLNHPNCSELYAFVSWEFEEIQVKKSLISLFNHEYYGYGPVLDEVTKKLITNALEGNNGSLTLTCKINALQSYDDASNVINESPINLYDGQCFRFEWNVNRALLDRMKMSEPDDISYIESEVYHNMFVLSLSPHYEKTDDLRLDVNWFCTTFESVKDYQISYTLNCLQTSNVYACDNYDLYHADDMPYSGHNLFHKISKTLSEFDGCDSITFVVRVTIRKKEDNYLDIVHRLNEDISLPDKIQLINGCSRKYCYDIPDDIIQLIVLFYPHLNDATCTWNICRDEPWLMDKIMNCKSTKETFHSDLFEVAGIKWRFGVRPRVFYDLKYIFYLDLHFVQLPVGLDSILCTCRVGIEYSNKSGDIIRFTTTLIHKRSVNNSTEARTDYFYYPILDQIKEAGEDMTVLNVSCYLNILKLFDKDKNVIYKYHNPANYKMYQTLEWRIDEKYKLDIIRNLNDQAHFESDIMDEMWCFRYAVEKGGWNSITLQLCSFATDQDTVDVRVDMKIYVDGKLINLDRSSMTLSMECQQMWWYLQNIDLSAENDIIFRAEIYNNAFNAVLSV